MALVFTAKLPLSSPAVFVGVIARLGRALHLQGAFRKLPRNAP